MSSPKRDPIDYVNHLKLEMDSRNPRTRLAVFGTLMEAKAPATTETFELAKAIADWAGEDVEALLTEYLESAMLNIPEEEVEDGGARERGAYI